LAFRSWLIENNGKGLESVSIFPILDDRDQRKTWDSIVRHREVWLDYCAEVFGPVTSEQEALLPFADFGTGDYYCFDYARLSQNGEPMVVHWSHETGETTPRGDSFHDFVTRLKAGEFDQD